MIEIIYVEYFLKKITSLKIITSSFEAAGWIFLISACSLSPSCRARCTASNPYSSRTAPINTHSSGHGEFRGGSLAPLWRYAGANAAILVGKVVERRFSSLLIFFTPLFPPKWPRLRPRSATTAQGSPAKVSVPRDIYVDRRCARGIRIQGRTARATARCQGAGRKTPIGTMVGKRGRRSASNFGDFDDFGANFLIFFQHHRPQQTSTACRGCEVEH